MLQTRAQSENKKEWYFSWGYNSDLWMPSNIRVQQKALNSDFTLVGVTAHDEPDWTTGIFNKGNSRATI
jgi:hypothetical protein